MAEAVLDNLRELREASEGLHWLCPRQSEEDRDNYDDELLQSDLATLSPEDVRKRKWVQESDGRRGKAVGGLQLFAVEEDNKEALDWYKDNLDKQLSRCDKCTMAYHQGKKLLMEQLRVEYDDEDLQHFFETIKLWDVERLEPKLKAAVESLYNTPTGQRNLSTIDVHCVFAMWEVLCDTSFLEREPLRSLFDDTFKSVQSNSMFRSPSFFPVLTAFLFDDDPFRVRWAIRSWSKLKKKPSAEEYDWAIREPLLQAMRRASQPGIDMEFVTRFWCGAKLIIESLDKNLITHSLRGMEVDIYRLALEHLQHDSPVLRFILQVIRTLLIKSPEDFWSAMGVITPTTLIQEIFRCPQFDRFLLEAQEKVDSAVSSLEDMISWAGPLIGSLAPAIRPAACKAAATQLIARLVSERFPHHVRRACMAEVLRLILSTLQGFTDSSFTSVDTIAAGEAIEIVSNHIALVLDTATSSSDDHARREIVRTAHDVLRNALVLDGKSLLAAYKVLDRGNILQHEVRAHSKPVWEAVSNRFVHNGVRFAESVLPGVIPLMGLERFKIKPGILDKEAKIQFNNTYGNLMETVSQMFIRLSEFDPEYLGLIFRNQDCANSLIGSLFSAEQSVYQAAVDVIKQLSGTMGRNEALSFLVEDNFLTSITSLCWAIQQTKRKGTFPSVPQMLRTCGDVLETLCNSQTGLLRRDVSTRDLQEMRMLEYFWEYQWQALAVIFTKTENWSANNDKETMAEFARDTIQYAENLFDQFPIFELAMESATLQNGSHGLSIRPGEIRKTLLQHPMNTFESMVKWLRLRDDFLLRTLVSLVCKLLSRLGESGIQVGEAALQYVENGASGRGYRTVLSPQQKAELLQALEQHQERLIVSNVKAYDQRQGATDFTSKQPGGKAAQHRKSTTAITSKIATRPGIIDLDQWRSKAQAAAPTITISNDEDYGDIPDADLLAASQSVEHQRAQQVAIPRSIHAIHPVPSQKAGNLKPSQPIQVSQKTAKAAEAAKLSFRQKREKEQAEKKKRDAAQIALQRKHLASIGIAALTADEGSGLSGIGVKGKDHAPKQSSMMVSDESSSSEEDEDDSDIATFKMGKSSKDSQQTQGNRSEGSRILNPALRQKPVKKMKQQRSVKDQRARLAPDLTVLHKTILGWDLFHPGDFPPNSEQNDYSMVARTFRTPLEYQTTFEPLLVLEAWQSFLKAKEEENFKPFTITIANRMTVDSFIEVNMSMTQAESKEIGLSEADIILTSKAQNPMKDAGQPHCLARVQSIKPNKKMMEISFRVNASNPMVSAFAPKATLRCVKVTSITPLEREYGALVALQYYDLCDEIIKAKPSPLLEYSDRHLNPLQDAYQVNRAQAKAISSAVDNDGFTLIQGPPGSGKTKTIVGIVGALLSDSLGQTGVSARTLPPGSTQPPQLSKRLLVCAPSNAAVDELVLRFKEGVKDTKGRLHQVSVVRLGRSDAINAAVRDVTLDELVKLKTDPMNGNTGSIWEEIGKLLDEHKSTNEAFNGMRAKKNEAEQNNQPIADISKQLDALGQKRTKIGSHLDKLREAAKKATRDAEINKRLIQQTILDGAHIICATLSGSAHEMMRNINIEFETVIIDEAAQSIELSALIPLKYGCSKCILVGDPKQLPPTVLSREASRFQYEQSLFVRMQENHPDYVHLLDTQYRMHPEISLFPSRAFYDGKLLDGANMAKIRSMPWHSSEILGPYRFFDVAGQQSNAPRGHSLINVAEVAVALLLYARLTSDYKTYDFKGKVGIITPYKSQLAELKLRFVKHYGESILDDVEFNTTDAFQGRESEVIIFSCVRASSQRGIGFLADIRRMNVGLTRAKSSLWVLGNSQSLIHGEYWGNLIKDAKTRKRYTSGNITALLQKPTAMNGMTVVLPSRGSVARADLSSPSDVEMKDAPSLGSTSSSRRSSLHQSITNNTDDQETNHQLLSRPPPPMGMECQVCGNPNHRAPDCDHPDAKAAAFGKCRRCGGLHFDNNCTAEICLDCGKVGHAATTCTSSQLLSKAARENLQRREAARKARNAEKRRKWQLNGHDPKVPVIRTTTPPDASRRNHDKAYPTQPTGKRKRDISPEKTTVGGLNEVLPKVESPIPAPPTSNSDTAGDEIVDKPPRTAPLPPGRAPPPPRKKKEVDPFIHRNKKRPRQ